MDPKFSPPPDTGVLDPRDLSAPTRRKLMAWLRLQSALCLSPTLASRCLETAQGDPEVALARSGKRPAVDQRGLEIWLEGLARDLVKIVPITAPAYPSRLRVLPDPPPVLLVRGSLEAVREPAVAIVGARAATRYGLGVAEALAGELARAGCVVVSGLARGIDASAHRGALAAGGWTIAVLGCGPDVVYPPEHRKLGESIQHRGAILSELPPGYPPARHHFPLRNRVISGLVEAVVVIEARTRSGSLITARHALEQGREVLVVPGPIDSVSSAGSNALFRDGAQPVLSVTDILGALGNGRPNSPSAGGPTSQAAFAARPLDPGEARLFEILLEEPANRDELIRKLGCSPRELALRVMGLELDEWIREDRDGRLRAVRRGPLGAPKQGD